MDIRSMMDLDRIDEPLEQTDEGVKNTIESFAPEQFTVEDEAYANGKVDQASDTMNIETSDQDKRLKVVYKNGTIIIQDGFISRDDLINQLGFIYQSLKNPQERHSFLVKVCTLFGIDNRVLVDAAADDNELADSIFGLATNKALLKQDFDEFYNSDKDFVTTKIVEDEHYNKTMETETDDDLGD